VGEGQPCGDGDGLQRAVLLAAVTAVALAGGRRDVFPGQRGELGVQAGLISLDHQDVVRAHPGDEHLGMLALSMQGIGGYHASGQVRRLQEGAEPGDFIGLAGHVRLRQHCPGLLVDSR